MEPTPRVHESVSLLPIEQLLRQLLLDCRDEMFSNPASSKLKIWFTGGWVRDKLLGIKSVDIDVTLSNMKGIRFGEALKEFFGRKGVQYEQEAKNLGIPPVFKGLHKVAFKPEKSKQLEIATAHVFGLDIDLVNLRKGPHTRSSQGGTDSHDEFGTPQEDACRREATINALYYNLDTQKIEDFTGEGLTDLAAGILKTPLDPHETFMDDPLRVLRIIRFSSKYGFSIDDETKNSMKDERIHIALSAKITRERVGTEILKMIRGPDPSRAFQLIYEMGLYSTVFFHPAGQLRQALTDLLPRQSDRPWPPTWPHAYNTLATLLEDNTILGRELAQSEEQVESCWVMAAYAPIATLRQTNSRQVARNVAEALKAANKTVKLLGDSLQHMNDIHSTIKLLSGHEQSPGSLPRSTIGMAIRSWGPTWRIQVLYSLLAKVVYEGSNDGNFERQLRSYSNFMEFVLEQQLQEAYLIKPILDGDEIKRLFNLQKSGNFIRKALDGILRWQFNHKESSRDEAIEWIRTQKDIFGIP